MPSHPATVRSAARRAPTAIAAVAALGIGLGLAGVPSPAGAQPPATVAVGSATIGEGLTGAVVVSIRGVSQLYGADVQLAFDPAVLEVVDANPDRPGVQVGLGPFLSPDMIVREAADNAAGTVHAAFTQINPAEPRDGSGDLFTVVFRARRSGVTTDVTVSSAVLADRNGMAIASTTTSGRVVVVPREQAPATPTAAPVAASTLVIAPPEGDPAGSGQASASRGVIGGPASGASAPTTAPPGGDLAQPAGAATTVTRPGSSGGAQPGNPGTSSTKGSGPARTGGQGADASGTPSGAGAASDTDAGDDGVSGAGGPSGRADAPAASGVDEDGSSEAAAAAADDAGARGTLWPWLVLAAFLIAGGIAAAVRRA